MSSPDDATITVTLSMPRSMGAEAFRISQPIGIFEARKLLAPIDFPSADAGLAMMFCTPGAELKLMERHDLIKHIAKFVAQALVDGIGAKDTVMGYPKDRYKTWDGYPS